MASAACRPLATHAHGLSGGDGRAGAAGIDGARGVDAPDIEIWVKRMTAMPNLDLNGEDGRQGGQGQRGGLGGNGANGEGGKRIWVFGWRCTSDPGDGGDGGDGGAVAGAGAAARAAMAAISRSACSKVHWRTPSPAGRSS